MREKFWDTNFTDESIVKDKSNYNPKCNNKVLTDIIDIIERTDPTLCDSVDNLSPTERDALKQLKSNSELIIKKDDNVLVIMDKQFYSGKLVLQDHLSTPTYSIAAPNADIKVAKNHKMLMTKHKVCLTEKELKYVTYENWESSNFYVLPKLYKGEIVLPKLKECNSTYLEIETPRDLKGRPIIAGPISPTQRLSELTHYILSPLVPCISSYLKDD